MAHELAKLIKKVESDIVNQKFNTSIAGMMELVNMWRGEGVVMSGEDVQKFAQVLSPFAPKVANSIWQIANGKGKVEDSGWPEMEIVELEVSVTIAVQVNGKLRSTVSVTRNTSENKDAVMKVVMGDAKIKKWIPESGVKKAVFVPGRLVNLVV